MSEFTSPAPKGADSNLYRSASPGLRKLMKQSRAELRQKGRQEYWQWRQQAIAEANETSTGSSTPAAPAATGTEAV